MKSVQISVPMVLPAFPAAPARRATYRVTSSVATTSAHHWQTAFLRLPPLSLERSSTPTASSPTGTTTYADSGALRSRQPR